MQSDMENDMDSDDQTENAEAKAPFLTLTEARVLACLMEKELTVPDSYPLTLNSLVLACNQKSNREPMMKMTEGEVGHIVQELAKRELVSIEYGGRARHIEHNVRKAISLNKAEQALLCVMMLRAPQTLNELKMRTKRMADFTDTDEIISALDRMNIRDDAMVLHIPRGPGQREDRYTHLLCGEPDIQTPAAAVFSAPVDEDKLAALEEKIEALEARVAKLESEQD